MINNLMRECNKLLVASLFFFSSVAASHNTSRYFLFLERPESYTTQRAYSLTADFFYVSSSNAFDRLQGGSTSLAGLWGEYSLNDVIKSAQTVQGDAFNLASLDDETVRMLNNKNFVFEFPGKIRSQGIALRGQFALPCYPCISAGFWIPIMHVSTRLSCQTALPECDNLTLSNSNSLIPNDVENNNLKLDTIRRELHDAIGLQENFWSETGLGDLDVYFRWQHVMHYTCMMRSISLNAQIGFLAPIGKSRDINHPSSAPLMSDDHWMLYFDFLPEFELKQDIKIGSLFSIMVPFGNTKTMRIAVGNEPHIFSALKGRISIEPGVTLKISPYLILENLTDGVHFQARYTYLRHNRDHWRDQRSDKTIPISLSDCEKLQRQEKLTSWRGHFFSFQVSYNTRMALNNFTMDPIFYVNYDLPIGGRGVAKMNQVSLGVQLHF